MRPRHGSRFGALLLAVAAVIAGTTSAQASWVFKFDQKVTSNTTESGGKYVLEVIQNNTTGTNGEKYIDFRVWNANGTAVKPGVVTEFYVQDGLLVHAEPVAYTYSNSGIEFDGGVPGPNNLPGGMSINPNFVATSGLTASAENPSAHKGVNGGEWAQFTYQLKMMNNVYPSYLDVVNLINSTYNSVKDGNGLPNPHLRFGIHVQSLAQGGSDSFINGGGYEDPDGYDPNDPTNPVPAPPAVLLAVIGVGLFGAVGRRMRRSQAAV